MKYLAVVLIGLGFAFFGESADDDDALAVVSPSLTDISPSRGTAQIAPTEAILKAHGLCNAEFVRARLNGVLVGLEDNAFLVNEWLFNSLSRKAKLDLVDTINCFVMGPAAAGADTLSKVVFVSSATHEQLASWAPASGLRLQNGERVTR